LLIRWAVKLWKAAATYLTDGEDYLPANWWDIADESAA